MPGTAPGSYHPKLSSAGDVGQAVSTAVKGNCPEFQGRCPRQSRAGKAVQSKPGSPGPGEKLSMAPKWGTSYSKIESEAGPAHGPHPSPSDISQLGSF